MPIILGAILRQLLLWGGAIAIQALLTMGLSFLTQEYAIDPLIALMTDYLSGAPENFVATVSYVGGDRAITIVLSAFVVRAGRQIALGRRRRA